MALELDRARLESIVHAVGDRLEGEWLLVGGALVALWLEPRRVTEDVDIVGLEGTAAERLALMELAEALGLPIESVNSAADFFVRRVDDWRDQLEVFYRGARGVVYRPSVTLFVLLKARRLSDRDLADCRAAIELAHREGLALDRARIAASLDTLPETQDDALVARRSALRALAL